MKISPYWKSAVAVLGAVVVAVDAVVGDLVVTGTEGVNIGIALLTAFGVYFVKNKDAKVAKWSPRTS